MAPPDERTSHTTEARTAAWPTRRRCTCWPRRSSRRRAVAAPGVRRGVRSIVVAGSFLDTRVLVPSWRQRFDAVTLEKNECTFRPDLTLAVGSRRLFVEIHVSHQINREKLSRIAARGVGTIELDFSRTPRSLTNDDLKRALVDTYAAKGRGRLTSSASISSLTGNARHAGPDRRRAWRRPRLGT